jgi:5-methylthioadenosine/S-adenosylhomocysteine deaminase
VYDILIRNITVLPMTTGGGALTGHDVAITGQHIVALGPSGALGAEAQRTFNGAGRALLPGLVNTHTHMGQTIFRGTAEAMLLQEWLEQDAPILRRMTAEDVYWSSMLACCEMLHAGITTFADMFLFESAVAQAAVDSGMRAQVAQGILERFSEEDLGRGAAEDQIVASVACAEEWHGAADGRITARVAPHALYSLSPSTLEALLSEAKRHGFGIHTHLSETRPELEWCQERYGVSPPQRFEGTGLPGGPLPGGPLCAPLRRGHRAARPAQRGDRSQPGLEPQAGQRPRAHPRADRAARAGGGSGHR